MTPNQILVRLQNFCEYVIALDLERTGEQHKVISCTPSFKGDDGVWAIADFENDCSIMLMEENCKLYVVAFEKGQNLGTEELGEVYTETDSYRISNGKIAGLVEAMFAE